ncbi:uncharacterized protein EDB93DRAFT_1250987 [Suillus bovinus]|uniref:uncharacterized protein n=1 Tax=Suillus bovinus TaxID=48563 RepID=UPI001B86DE7B|nr:uncharacterized protein EDB93DRAFT_1250987 [Suillus bovinus]KAG2146452.1 hypothetical protein EDB93DRAFT_1250987 [Suillus bovinus]
MYQVAGSLPFLWGVAILGQVKHQRSSELQSGAQFNHAYKDFDAMQAAFLAFVQNALMFKSSIPHKSANDEDEESSLDSGSDKDNEWERNTGKGREGMSQDFLPFDTCNLFGMTPHSDEIFGDNVSSLSNTLLDARLPEALPSGVSTDASSGPVSMTGASNNLSLAELFCDSHSATLDPIKAGTTNFSTFDPHAFTDLVSNSTALDKVSLQLDISQQAEVLLPAVPSMHSKEEEDDQEGDLLVNQPELLYYLQVYVHYQALQWRMRLVFTYVTVFHSIRENATTTLVSKHITLTPWTCRKGLVTLKYFNRDLAGSLKDGSVFAFKDWALKKRIYKTELLQLSINVMWFAN